MSAAPAGSRGPARPELDIRRYLDGVGPLLAGNANVIMQLSWPAVGHGVVESKVESGQVTRHPFKRGRTTLTYISVALLGNDADRAAYRKAVNTSHVQVRSDPDSVVAYNAFDPELQLWVAACLYYGTRDIVAALHGELEPEVADALYQHAAHFGTTLQVRPEQWPADRAAFDAYWDASLALVDIDETVAAYLLDLLDSRQFPLVIRLPSWRLVRFMNVGFLPPFFREQLGLEWTAANERWFRSLLRALGGVYRHSPRITATFPFNFYLWDVRRRVRQGRPLV
ncbi:MAG: hypothetical protein JWR35_785 [Marmoricola sp.]|nr:hypothetical protein [Marmoricola sp.]